jgi:hypothetical protein
MIRADKTSTLSEELDDIFPVQSLFRGVKEMCFFLRKTSKRVLTCQLLLTSSKLDQSAAMTRLTVMAMEDRCGRFVALAITAKFYGG